MTKMLKADMFPKAPNLWYSWRVRGFKGYSDVVRVHLVPVWGIGRRWSSDTIALYTWDKEPRPPLEIAKRVREEADGVLKEYNRSNAKRLRKKADRKMRGMYTGAY